MAGNVDNVESGIATVLGRVPVEVAVVGLVFGFWTSLPFDGSVALLDVVQSATGSALFLFVPGALLSGLLGLGAGSTGRFLLYAVGLSVSLLAVLVTLASVAFPLLGAGAPIAVLPLALVGTVVVLALAAFVNVGTPTFPSIPAEIDAPALVVGFLLLLPVVSVVAAQAMNRWQTNVGMYVLVGLLLVLLLLSATRVIPASLYPATALSVSLAMLFHRNLLTDHVVGADIQSLYAIAEHLVRVGVWSPGMAGQASALPVVTAVPAALSVLTGLSVATTYKTLYVFVFALTPVGLYYVARDVFDEEVALFGALFFSIYHVSFYFTPGKQLVSELFVVLLLSTLWSDAPWPGRALAVALLSTALVMTHYGMTYVFAVALLSAAVALLVGRLLFDEVGGRLPVGYPVLLLVGATAWYASVSSELLARLASLPIRTVDQVARVLTRGTPEGSGASYVSAQTTTLEVLHVHLYLLLTALVAVGIAWRTGVHLVRLYRGDDPGRADYTAIAVPLFAFLGASYVLVFDLWADRVYQLVLVVVAPFLAYGYGRIATTARTAVRRVGALGSRVAEDSRPLWGLLAVILALLLAFNSGMAFALAGSAQTSTFDPGANDLVFREGEIAGAKWLADRPEVRRTDAAGTPSSAERVRIYTDSVGAQLFRAVLNERYYTVDVVTVKNRFRPAFDPSELGVGYVFVRKRAETTEPEVGTLPPSYLSRDEVDGIEARGRAVFRNDAVVIYQIDEPADP